MHACDVCVCEKFHMRVFLLHCWLPALYVGMYACMCVCVYVCVCVHVCMHVCDVCICGRIHMRVFLLHCWLPALHACIYVRTYVSVHIDHIGVCSTLEIIHKNNFLLYTHANAHREQHRNTCLVFMRTHARRTSTHMPLTNTAQTHLAVNSRPLAQIGAKVPRQFCTAAECMHLASA
jgi:hypothetical protein